MAADEVVGKVLPELFHDPDELRARRARFLVAPGQKSTDMFLRSLEARKESSEWTYIRKDGTRVPVLVTMSAICDSKQHVLGYLSVVTDLTIHKQAQLAQKLGAAEVQRLQAAIQRLDFSAAAEILQPIEPLLTMRRAAQA